MLPCTFVEPLRRMLGTPRFALWRCVPALGQCWRVSWFESIGRRRLVRASKVRWAAICCRTTLLVKLVLAVAGQISAALGGSATGTSAGRLIGRTTCRHKPTTHRLKSPKKRWQCHRTYGALFGITLCLAMLASSKGILASLTACFHLVLAPLLPVGCIFIVPGRVKWRSLCTCC